MRAASALLALSLLPWSAPADADDAETAVRAALTRWTEAFNSRDADGVCDLFAPDLRSSYRGGPDRDHAELCAQLRRIVTDPDRQFRYQADIKEVVTSGELAVVRLDWDFEVRDRQGELLDRGIDVGMDVFRRQPDGQWRIARFVAYDLPPP
jgi:steroid delta-isomerase